MHFGRAVVDTEATHLIEDARDQRFIRHALAAQNLHAAIDDNARSPPSNTTFDIDELHRPAPAIVQQPGGVPDGQAAQADIHFVVGELEAHAFMVDQLAPKHLPLQRITRCDLMRSAGGAEPAHAVSQARGGEADLCVAEALAGLTQDVGGRNAQVVELHDRVAAGKGAVQAVHGADDFDAGRVHVGQEHGGVAVFILGHDDGEGRAFRAGDEPLGAVDDVVVAVLHRGGGHGGGVRSGAGRGLGHAEAGSGGAGREGAQPTLLLLMRRDGFHEVHVAFVGGEDVHRDGAEQGVAGFLEHDGLADMGQAEAAIFGADMRGDQAFRGGEGHEFAAEFLGGAVVGLAGVALHRDDLVADEGAGAVLEFLEFG